MSEEDQIFAAASASQRVAMQVARVELARQVMSLLIKHSHAISQPAFDELVALCGKQGGYK